jgi:hypothetical protein
MAENEFAWWVEDAPQQKQGTPSFEILSDCALLIFGYRRLGQACLHDGNLFHSHRLHRVAFAFSMAPEKAKLFGAQHDP